MSWNHPDDVPMSLTRRAYALRGVTLSQNQYAAVVADAYEDIARAVAHELAEKIQADMEEIRAMDWGKSSRSKRPYLQGMERAKKAIEPQKEGQ